MNAAVLYGKEDVRIERVPVPELAAGEVLIRVEAALTCGTDLKVFRRGYHAKMLVPPALFGHEFAGVIVSVGEGVTSWRQGERVVALNSAPCGACYFCQRDQENLCEDLIFNNGAYAEYIRIPARIVAKNMLRVPAEMSFAAAALTEPLACVVRGLDEMHPRAGDSVAVIGAGPIGLMFMQTAQAYGLRVIAVVKRDEQVTAALHFGADEVVQISKVPDAVQAVRELTDGRGVDIAIECIAQPLGWQWAVEMVRKGGSVNFFGGCESGTKVELDTNRIHYSELSLKATFHHTPAAARKAFGLVRDGKIRSEDFVTGEAPLSELKNVLCRMADRNGEIKTVILPR
ncbi:MAG: zinc-binding dehydrogenase [Acidobacteriales bacterium]|nr:zinc-binding dehydrogenase [Terriglobales bacterium]